MEMLGDKMAKKKRFEIGTVGYIILGVVMAFAINQGLAMALSTDMPVVAVESNSMVPAFSKGDILILQGATAEQMKVGDIIVFSPPSHTTPVVHRIVAINPDGSFQTKGDANGGQLSFETHIMPDQIHGRVVLMVPLLGWVKIGTVEYVLPNMWLVVIIVCAAAGAYYAKPYAMRKIKEVR